MRKADDHDLRRALSEEVENLEPSDELWNKIYSRSVVTQAKRRIPWLKGGVAMGSAAAAAAVVLLLTGPWSPGTGPEPPAGPGPVALVQPLAVPEEDPTADRLFVRYNQTLYWYNGESVPTEELGDLLTLTTRAIGDGADPQPDGSSNLPEVGQEVRAIKGSDPLSRIAVQADQAWYAFDNMLQPIAPAPPNQ